MTVEQFTAFQQIEGKTPSRAEFFQYLREKAPEAVGIGFLALLSLTGAPLFIKWVTGLAENASTEGESPLNIISFNDGNEGVLTVWRDGSVDFSEYNKFKKKFSGKSAAVPPDGLHFGINIGQKVEIIDRRTLKTVKTFDAGGEIVEIEWHDNSRIVARVKGENGLEQQEFKLPSLKQQSEGLPNK